MSAKKGRTRKGYRRSVKTRQRMADNGNLPPTRKNASKVNSKHRSMREEIHNHAHDDSNF